MGIVCYQVSAKDVVYDDFADVLYVKFSDTEDSFGRETPSGLIVHFSISTGDPVGLTITDFCTLPERQRQVFEVDTEFPFEVRIDDISIACSG